jgi:dTDP-4-dehydrorhamnose 3,5-epimerase
VFDPLSILSISTDFRDKVTTQEYGKRQSIDGFKIIDLKLMTDDGGSFTELARIDETGHLEAYPEFHVRQISYSLLLPGAIKAFHLHFCQEDVWFVPPADRLLVGLIDVRADSATRGISMRIPLGGGKAQLLVIPRGVGHGVANLGTVPASIFYFVSQQFDINDPDERRLPYDCLGKDFWSIQPG